MIHLISEIPEPAAYGANERTRLAEVRANIVYGCQQRGPVVLREAHSKHDIQYVVDGSQRTPPVPVIATCIQLASIANF